MYTYIHIDIQISIYILYMHVLHIHMRNLTINILTYTYFASWMSLKKTGPSAAEASVVTQPTILGSWDRTNKRISIDAGNWIRKTIVYCLEHDWHMHTLETRTWKGSDFCWICYASQAGLPRNKAPAHLPRYQKHAKPTSWLYLSSWSFVSCTALSTLGSSVTASQPMSQQQRCDTLQLWVQPATLSVTWRRLRLSASVSQLHVLARSTWSVGQRCQTALCSLCAAALRFVCPFERASHRHTMRRPFKKEDKSRAAAHKLQTTVRQHWPIWLMVPDHQIKKTDNPTRQLLPIMSTTCCSRDGERRKDKGGGGGPRSKTKLRVCVCVTKLYVEDGVWQRKDGVCVCDKVVCERWCVRVKVVYERERVTKLCAKDGVWQSGVWNMVWRKMVCDKVVWERLCVETWCVTKMVCEKMVCVCV